MANTPKRGRKALKAIRNPDLRDLVSDLLDRGYGLELRRSGHVKVTAPDGTPFFAPSTPTDYRGIKNFEALIRRHQ